MPLHVLCSQARNPRLPRRKSSSAAGVARASSGAFFATSLWACAKGLMKSLPCAGTSRSLNRSHRALHPDSTDSATVPANCQKILWQPCYRLGDGSRTRPLRSRRRYRASNPRLPRRRSSTAAGAAGAASGTNFATSPLACAKGPIESLPCGGTRRGPNRSHRA